MATSAPTPIPTAGFVPRLTSFTADLAQAAGTYTLATCTGGVLIKSVTIFVATAGATLTSVAVQTNNTTVDAILSAVEGAVANVTGGKNLKVYTTLTVLPTTKLITYAIVGASGAGALTVVVEWVPLTSTSTLA